MRLTHRDFISIKQCDGSEYEAILQLAITMKSDRDHKNDLQDNNIGMLFSVASTRTRLSFQVAVRRPGAHESIISDQAENRLHAQAILTACISQDSASLSAESAGRLLHRRQSQAASVPIV